MGEPALALGPVAECSTDIERMEAEIGAENERRYAFYRMLAATDRLLWRLEELNCDEVRRLREDVVRRMRDSLYELPASILAHWRDSLATQELLDGVFDIQDALFRYRDPERPAAETEAAPAVRRADLTAGQRTVLAALDPRDWRTSSALEPHVDARTVHSVGGVCGTLAALGLVEARCSGQVNSWRLTAAGAAAREGGV